MPAVVCNPDVEQYGCRARRGLRMFSVRGCPLDIMNPFVKFGNNITFAIRVSSFYLQWSVGRILSKFYSRELALVLSITFRFGL